MKSEKKILIAFLLNLAFSVLEVVGGILTGSVAIASDAVHDMGDAASIGASYLFERKSKKEADEVYTYGYARYSLLGGALTTLILLVGSLLIIVSAVKRLLSPVEIDYNGMIGIAIAGVIVNLAAAFFTHKGSSLNQKAINLHMLEDVLGWAVVLIGAVVMRFTDLAFLDPLMSICVSAVILATALGNMRRILDLFLERTPHGISVKEVGEHIVAMEGVIDVHHIHLWSIDGATHCVTMHVVADGEAHEVKERIRGELRGFGIGHATLELESAEEHCHEEECHRELVPPYGHHHHCHRH